MEKEEKHYWFNKIVELEDKSFPTIFTHMWHLLSHMDELCRESKQSIVYFTFGYGDLNDDPGKKSLTLVWQTKDLKEKTDE